MSFKTHLTVIVCIIVVVLLSWQYLNNMPSHSAAVSTQKSPYTITITHASWELNCRGMTVNTDNDIKDSFVKKEENSKLHEDNVLGPVALLCNGNTECNVDVSEDVLGNDPAPTCNPKTLEVEYRCFSYDRPWFAKASTGTLSLHCEQPVQ